MDEFGLNLMRSSQSKPEDVLIPRGGTRAGILTNVDLRCGCGDYCAAATADQEA